MARTSSGRRRPALTEDAAGRLLSAALGLTQRIRRSDESAGLSAARIAVLARLAEDDGPRTVGDLARAEGVRAPTMTRLVQSLEHDRLIRRARDDDDRRAVRLDLTAPGRRALARARARRVDVVADVLGPLSTEEARRVRNAAERVMDGLRGAGDG